MISFSRWEMSFWSFIAAATAATPAARCLRLRELALEGIGLDEEHVGARFGAGILRRGVEAHDVARHQP